VEKTYTLPDPDQNKAETRLVNHDHGYSSYDENLTLEFNLVYDESKGIYEDKNVSIWG